MGLDHIERPTVSEDLSSYPLESLREELNSLNKGLDELLRRRGQVTTAINIKLEDTRMHLMQSDEFYAKATGQYEGEERNEPISNSELKYAVENGIISKEEALKKIPQPGSRNGW